MTERFVAFIRAIMIGREGLSRQVVLDAFEAAGAVASRNHLTTGNVSFDARRSDLAGIVEAASATLSGVKGRETPILVRGLAELSAIPFDDIFAEAPPGYDHARLITFLTDDAPDVELPMAGPRDLSVVFQRRGRELFSASRLVDGEHSDPGGLLQRRLGVPITTRTVGTIEKILRAQS